MSFWLVLIAFLLILLSPAVYLTIRDSRGKGVGSSIDVMASWFLERRPGVDPQRYYVVFIDTDMGAVIAYSEGRRTPPVREFDDLEEARRAARAGSVDPEDEIYACIFRGRKALVAAYRGGREL